MTLATMTRDDLEMAILENDIVACDAEGIAKIQAMGTEELRAVVGAWIEAGDECADA
jgi:hypothetical protein